LLLWLFNFYGSLLGFCSSFPGLRGIWVQLSLVPFPRAAPLNIAGVHNCHGAGAGRSAIGNPNSLLWKMAQVIVDLPNLEVVILNSFLMFFVCLPEGNYDGWIQEPSSNMDLQSINSDHGTHMLIIWYHDILLAYVISAANFHHFLGPTTISPEEDSMVADQLQYIPISSSSNILNQLRMFF
jgi:hypothetical protein